ncbi:MAG: HAMP domain-containing sensor histidine kinase [Thermodesulfobacteriota bacterium]
MPKPTFRIRRRIIQAFLFCVLAILFFAGLSFQAHWEMGKRLKLVEQADDLVNNILELRRLEKNFFLYREPESLREARLYLYLAKSICCEGEEKALLIKKESKSEQVQRILEQYQGALTILENLLQKKGSGLEYSGLASSEESLRELGHQLLSLSKDRAKEERAAIDRLFLRAFYLFLVSIIPFLLLGLLVALYISRLLLNPLFQMEQYMEKIAGGDFTPIPESECKSKEFFSLFQAFNRMIKELEQHQEKLLQSGKIAAIGTLTAGIAHELNNPINNIVLTAETLKEDGFQLSREEVLEMIQDILSQSGRASEIVKNLLDFSRAEQPEREPVDVSQVIRYTLKLVQNQASLFGVEVKKDFPGDLPVIHGDQKALQQVFLNLFINAIQAMQEGGTLAVRARSEDGGQWLKVEVTDTGTGIDPEVIPHIFEPFYTTKEVGRGTGLGLSVSYGIVQKHGGHIEVRSKKGEGSTFTVVLPVEKEG